MRRECVRVLQGAGFLSLDFKVCLGAGDGLRHECVRVVQRAQ